MDKKNTSLIFQLLKTSQLIKKKINNEIPENLNHLPFELFSHLGSAPQSLTSLTQKMQCSKQETTRQVQRAQKHGWVSLTPSSDDKRSKQVNLTKKAKDLLQQGTLRYQQLEQQWFNELSAENISQLLNALKKIDKALEDN